MPQFAVIDVETTGLSPAHHHRVVEVAVVLVDESGKAVHQWDTLVNPQRDVGASDIHGLTAAELYDAPPFAEVAGDIAALLAGRVPVAHNLAFDAGFLAAEFSRLGAEIPLIGHSGLCTMRMAGHYLPIGRRSLAACCEFIEYPLTDAHAALADAVATSALLAYYLQHDRREFQRTWGSVVQDARRWHWPKVPQGSGRRLSRMDGGAAAPEHFLARLASRAPRPVVAAEVEPYIEALDRVLLNRHISRHEADELVSVATMLGLGREDALEVHRLYLHALCVQALADGVVTKEERVDLERVMELLGLSVDDVEAGLSEAAAARESEEANETDASARVLARTVGAFRLQPGDRVVFTGETPGVSRRTLEIQSRDAGLRVTGSVSGRTSLLVAADPDSISGKARRARELDIPIVDVATFVRMLELLGYVNANAGDKQRGGNS